MSRRSRRAADPDRRVGPGRGQARIGGLYDRAAGRYDELAGRTRYRRRAERIEQPFRAFAGQVLELGCGTGRLLERTAGPRFGVDLSPAMLARARKRGLAVARADAHRLPFSAGSFDAVFAGKGVFRYLEAGPALRECARVLRPGGLLGVHQYSVSTWSLRGHRAPEPLHLDSAAELSGPAAAAGFALVAERRWRSIGAPPWALALPTWLPGRFWSQIVLIYRRGVNVTAPGCAPPY